MDSPSPPLLHEVKLPGLVTGGGVSGRLHQEGKLALLHEVKLSGLGTGGGVICRLRQEGKLALLHEVKLSGPGTGGAVWCRLRQEGKLTLLHEVKLCTSQVDLEKVPQCHLYHRSSGSSATCTSHKKYLTLAKEYPDPASYRSSLKKYLTRAKECSDPASYRLSLKKYLSLAKENPDSATLSIKKYLTRAKECPDLASYRSSHKNYLTFAKENPDLATLSIKKVCFPQSPAGQMSRSPAALQVVVPQDIDYNSQASSPPVDQMSWSPTMPFKSPPSPLPPSSSFPCGGVFFPRYGKW